MKRHAHYWLDTGIPSPLIFLDNHYRYDCSVCGKRIWRKHQPLNPTVPSAWEVYENRVRMENADMVMQPPMLVSEENQFIEGERYKKLIEGML